MRLHVLSAADWGMSYLKQATCKPQTAERIIVSLQAAWLAAPSLLRSSIYVAGVHAAPIYMVTMNLHAGMIEHGL
jgi:hypothetical protein